MLIDYKEILSAFLIPHKINGIIKLRKKKRLIDLGDEKMLVQANTLKRALPDDGCQAEK